jgi:hypothetical protein
MMKNDFPLCEFLLVETINTRSFGWDNQYRGKALPEHHGFSYPPMLDLENQ